MQPIIYRRTFTKLKSEKNTLLILSSCWMAVSLVGLSELLWGAGSSLGFLFVIGLLLAAITIARFMRYSRHGTPADNFLRLDDDGVTHGTLGKARHWPWSELSEFELRGGKKFWFWTGFRHVPIAKRGETGETRLMLQWRRGSTGILEEYGTPLDEIAAKLNAYREQALSGGPARSRA